MLTTNDPIADMKNQIKNMDSIIQNLQQKEKSNSLMIKSLQQENYNNKTAIINPRITINDSVPNNSPKTVSKSTIITPIPIIKNFVISENG
jgi:hypothetical protein